MEIVGNLDLIRWADGDSTGQDQALRFCKVLTDADEKIACYNTIFARALDLFPSKKDLRNFCLKAEANFQNSCLNLN